MSFFAQPFASLDDLKANHFFLRNAGHGLTKADVDGMTLEDVRDEVKRIQERLAQEEDARKEQQAKMDAAARRRR